MSLGAGGEDRLRALRDGGARAALKRARGLVFDFDGTLVDSNPIKWAGFEEVFADAPAERERIMAYCRTVHHVVRTDKFRHVYKEILRRPYTPAVEAKLQATFSAATTKRIVGAREIPGAAAFVRAAARTRLTGLLSTTPHELLVEIVGRRGWTEWFTQVRGSPVHKASWLRQFCVSQRLAAEEVVMIGDTAEDAAAAEEAGCGFLGVGRGLADSGVAVIEDFRAVAGWLGAGRRERGSGRAARRPGGR